MLSDVMRTAMRPHEKVDGLSAHDPRPEGGRVVVLFHRTGVCRLFEKLDAVGNWYSADAYSRSVYVSPRQMSARLTDGQMLACISRMCLESFVQARASEASGLDLANILWSVCQRHGDLVSREAPQATRESESNKYHVNLTLLRSDETKSTLDKQPKQCRVVAEALYRHSESIVSDDEMDSLARRTHTAGLLKTKQDPCRIFRYYLPTLAQLGLVEYKTRRIQDDGGGDSSGEDGSEE